jgi:predicted HAD superfamily Cof-like phosphohydrolase
MTPCPFCKADNFIVSTPPNGPFRASHGCTKCSAYVMADSIEAAMTIWKKAQMTDTNQYDGFDRTASHMADEYKEVPVWWSSIDSVREFHQAFGHPVAEKPTGGDKALRELRIKLIAEELGELCEALGVDLTLKAGPWSAHTGNNECKVSCVVDAVDLVEAADALGDLDYVIQGANLVFGFPSMEIFQEIHRSNMSKLGDDGKPIYREDGKIMKGPNYFKPDIKKVMEVDRAIAELVSLDVQGVK